MMMPPTIAAMTPYNAMSRALMQIVLLKPEKLRIKSSWLLREVE
jgi:hypothetical protein